MLKNAAKVLPLTLSKFVGRAWQWFEMILNELRLRCHHSPFEQSFGEEDDLGGEVGYGPQQGRALNRKP